MILFGETRTAGVSRSWASSWRARRRSIEWAAAYAAKAARALTNDPARPLQTLALNRHPGGAAARALRPMELNSLAGYGIATQKIGGDKQPMILRETTTYQLNLYGQRDDAYELVTTLATLAQAAAQSEAGDHVEIPAPQAGQRRHQLRPRSGHRHARHHQGRAGRASIGRMSTTAWSRTPQRSSSNLLVERDPEQPEPRQRAVSAGPDQPAPHLRGAGAVPAAVRPGHRHRRSSDRSQPPCQRGCPAR